MTEIRGTLECEYVLPLRWSEEQSRGQAAEMTGYLRWLSRLCPVTVVDGSEPPVFRRHAQLWGSLARHLPPDAGNGLNGKVAGVITGVRAAGCERVVVADDDVRFTSETLHGIVDGLDVADLVRPQNVFTSLPWHARWDTGRTLLNRCFGVDYPGTHAVRRSTFLAMEGYDGNALFENLELARTVTTHGGRVLDLPGLFVPRRPPTAAHFWSQRVRQAYDSLAQPDRLVVELAVIPVLGGLAVRDARRLPVLAVVVVAVAERGRRRAGGASVYPATASLWAIPWVLERGVCSWLALWARARGGVRYGGHRIPRAATPTRTLASRAEPRSSGGPAGPVAEPGERPTALGHGRVRTATR